MSDYTFKMDDALSLLNDLEDMGFELPERLGFTKITDLRMKLAEEIVKIMEDKYMPAYYQEGGGP
jgi:hypothetical protein